MDILVNMCDIVQQGDIGDRGSCNRKQQIWSKERVKWSNKMKG